MKRINKQVIQDLKNLTNWLNANKICPKKFKTKAVLFQSSRKQIFRTDFQNTDFSLKLILDGKRRYPTNLVEYVDIRIDENLNRKQHIFDIAIKLNKKNPILCTLRHVLDSKTLKLICPAADRESVKSVN